MKFKKIIALITTSLLLFGNDTAVASDNFVDNNAIAPIINKNKEAKIVISEYNTGKIIAQKNESDIVEYRTLANKIAVYILAEQLRDNKLTLDSTIELIEEDDLLKEYQIANEITVKDAIFLLEQKESTVLLKSIIKQFDIKLEEMQNTISKLSLRDTSLNSLELSSENKTTAKNLAFLTETTVKNFPAILDITKNPQFEFKNGEKAENSIDFIESDRIRSLGLSYSNSTVSTVTYSGNTRILVTMFNISEEKEDFFKTLQEVYEYIFNNYSYKLALNAGTYDINNENITIENDIYDLFYKDHSEKDIRYFLMNKKILLFQNYNYLSANSGTVFSNYISNTNNTNLTNIRNTFLQDNKFDEKPNKEKMDIIINRTQYFAAFALLVYTAIFIIIYILRRPFRKGE